MPVFFAISVGSPGTDNIEILESFLSMIFFSKLSVQEGLFNFLLKIARTVKEL